MAWLLLLVGSDVGQASRQEYYSLHAVGAHCTPGSHPLRYAAHCASHLHQNTQQPRVAGVSRFPEQAFPAEASGVMPRHSTCGRVAVLPIQRSPKQSHAFIVGNECASQSALPAMWRVPADLHPRSQHSIPPAMQSDCSVLVPAIVLCHGPVPTQRSGLPGEAHGRFSPTRGLPS